MGCTTSKGPIQDPLVAGTAHTEASTTEAPLQPTATFSKAPLEKQQPKHEANNVSNGNPKDEKELLPAPCNLLPAAEQDGTIFPTRLNAAESQEFKQQLETSLQVKEQKRSLGNVIRAGNKATVVEYKQRMQVIVLSDNASVHSKEVSMELLNNSLGSVSMASVDSQSTPTGVGKASTRHRRTSKSSTGHNNSSSNSSKSRSSSDKKHTSVDRPGDNTRRIPSNNPRRRSTEHSTKDHSSTTGDARDHSKQSRMDDSGSTRHRKESRNNPSPVTPKSRRNKVHTSLNQETAPLAGDATSGPIPPTSNDISSMTNLDDCKSSPQPRRHRRPVEATNQMPRENHANRQEEKISINREISITRDLSSSSIPRGSFSSNKSLEFEAQAKPASPSKRRVSSRTKRRSESHHPLPENKARTPPRGSKAPSEQSSQTITDTNPPSCPASPSLSTPTSASESDIPTSLLVESTPASATDATGSVERSEPIAEITTSQHSLGLPSQHSLGSYLPEGMKSSSFIFSECNMEHGTQTPSTSRRSSISELVRKMNPMKRKSDTDGRIALMDSNDNDQIDDFDVKASRSMASVFDQIIKRPLLSQTSEEKEENAREVMEGSNSREMDESTAGESVNSIDIFTISDGIGTGGRSSSQDQEPVVFKFDASDPSIAQFDPNKESALNGDFHNSCSAIDRIHQRQSLRDRRTAATRSHQSHSRDSINENLGYSCSQVESLKSAQVSAVQKRRTKEGGKIKQQSDSKRPGKSPADVAIVNRKDEVPMKDESSSTASQRRQRHTHAASSPRKTPPSTPPKFSGSPHSGGHRTRSMSKRQKAPNLSRVKFDESE